MGYYNISRNNSFLGLFPGGGGFVLPDSPPEPPIVVDPPVMVEPDRPDIVDPALPPEFPPISPLIYSRRPRPLWMDFPPEPLRPQIYTKRPRPGGNLPGQEIKPEGEAGESVETGTGLKLKDFVKIHPPVISVPGETLVKEAGVDSGGIPGWLKIGATLAGLALIFNATKEPVRKWRR